MNYRKLILIFLLFRGSCFSPFSVASTYLFIHGGRIDFNGQVANAACSLSLKDQTIQLPQVRKGSFNGIGSWHGDTEFNIELDDCNPSLKKYVSIIFKGKENSSDPQTFNIDNGAGSAKGIGLGVFDSYGYLALPNTEPINKFQILKGNTTLKYIVKYRQVEERIRVGSVNSELLFNILYY